VAGLDGDISSERIPKLFSRFFRLRESIGVGLVPTENARALVPAEFVLQATVSRSLPLSFGRRGVESRLMDTMTASAELFRSEPSSFLPTSRATSTHYTMFFYTDDLRLALRLNLAGLLAQFDPRIVYDFDNQNSLSVRVPFPAFRRLTLTERSRRRRAAGSFTANWWQRPTAAGQK
jgi:hypothetical protein